MSAPTRHYLAFQASAKCQHAKFYFPIPKIHRPQISELEKKRKEKKETKNMGETHGTAPTLGGAGRAARAPFGAQGAVQKQDIYALVPVHVVPLPSITIYQCANLSQKM